MKKVSFFVFSVLIFSLFASCNHGISGAKNPVSDVDYASVSFKNQDLSSLARSAAQAYNPSALSEDNISMVSLEVEGVLQNGKTYQAEFLEGGSALEWNSFEQFKKAEIRLMPGKYNFYLNLFGEGVDGCPRLTQSGKLTNIELAAGDNKKLKFTTSYVSNGDLCVTYKWPATWTTTVNGKEIQANTGIKKVEMGLFPITDKTSFSVPGFDLEAVDVILDEEEGYYSATYCAKDVPNGKYLLKMIPYSSADDENSSELTGFVDIVTIYGYKTVGTKILKNTDYNQIYYITLDTKGVYCWGDNVISHDVFHSIDLEAEGFFDTDNDEYIFLGWYTDQELSEGTRIKRLEIGMDEFYQNITLYAKWVRRVNYTIDISSIEDALIEVEDEDGNIELTSNYTYSSAEDDLFAPKIKDRFGYKIDYWYGSFSYYDDNGDLVEDIRFGNDEDLKLINFPDSDGNYGKYGTLTFTENGVTKTYTHVKEAYLQPEYTAYSNMQIEYYFFDYNTNGYESKSVLDYKGNPYDAENHNIEVLRKLCTYVDTGYIYNEEKTIAESGEDSNDSNIYNSKNYFDKNQDSFLCFSAKATNESGGLKLNVYGLDGNLSSCDGFYNIVNEDGIVYAAGLAAKRTVGEDVYIYIIQEVYTEEESNTYNYYRDGSRYTLAMVDNYKEEYSDNTGGALQRSKVDEGNVVFNHGSTLSQTNFKVEENFVSGNVSDITDSSNYTNGAMIVKADFVLDDDGLDSNVKTEFVENKLLYQNPKIYVSFIGDNAAVEIDGTTKVTDDVSYRATLLYQGRELASVDADKISSNYIDLISEGEKETKVKISRVPYKGTYQLNIQASRTINGTSYVSSKLLTFTTNGKWIYTIDYEKNESFATNQTQMDFKADLPYIPAGIVDIEIHGNVRNNIQHFIDTCILSPLSGDYGNLLLNIDAKDVSITDSTAFDAQISGSTHLLSIAIPEGVQTLVADSISGCENLETIYLPESLASLDDTTINDSTVRNPFGNCGKKFVIPETNKSFKTSEDGTMILSKDGTTVMMFAEGLSDIDIKDESITQIDSNVNSNNIQSLAIDTSKVFVSWGYDATNNMYTGPFGNKGIEKLILKNAELKAEDFEDNNGNNSTYNIFCNVINSPFKELVFQGKVEIPNTKVTGQEDDGNGEMVEVEHIKSFFERFKNLTGSIMGLKSITFNGDAEIQESAFSGDIYNIYNLNNGTSITFNANANIRKSAFSDATISGLKFNGDSTYTIGEKAFYMLAVPFDLPDLVISEIDLTGAASIGSMAFGPVSEYYDGDEIYYYTSPIQKIIMSSTADCAADAFAKSITVVTK